MLYHSVTGPLWCNFFNLCAMYSSQQAMTCRSLCIGNSCTTGRSPEPVCAQQALPLASTGPGSCGGAGLQAGAQACVCGWQVPQATQRRCPGQHTSSHLRLQSTANKQTNKLASKQASKQANKQACKQATRNKGLHPLCNGIVGGCMASCTCNVQRSRSLTVSV